MISTLSLDLTSSRIANFYNISQGTLASSLVKLSSGKNYNSPKDGVAEYFKIDRLNRNRRGYEDVRRNLERGIAIVNTAERFAMELVEGFKQLKMLTYDYWNEPVGSDQRAARTRDCPCHRPGREIPALLQKTAVSSCHPG